LEKNNESIQLKITTATLSDKSYHIEQLAQYKQKLKTNKFKSKVVLGAYKATKVVKKIKDEESSA
jgi:hypothetical protein